MACSVWGLPLREPTKDTLKHAGPVLVAGHAPSPFKELQGLRPYDLRHLHASLLLARGVSLRTVSERLGHANPGFTLSTYTHVVPSGQEAAALLIGQEVFGKGKAKPKR
jgi:integrase